MAVCSICGSRVGEDDGREYPGLVCEICDGRAVNLAGQTPQVSPHDEGDNPIFIGEYLCWRRYRFGGWVTMRDDTPSRTLGDFCMTHVGAGFPELLMRAQEALAAGVSVPSGVSHSLPKESRYRGGDFELDGTKWIVIQTDLKKEHAQILDVALNYRALRKADRVLCTLDPPEPGVRDESTDDFLSRYQRAAWHGLGVAFVTADRPQWRVHPVRLPRQSAFLDLLVGQLRGELIRLDVEEFAGSKEAEKAVYPLVDRVLSAWGFKSASRSYKTFYRGASSDGFWTREGGEPQRVALEVKLEEDQAAPFNQVIDNLGRADAVIQIRLVNRRTRRSLDGIYSENPWVLPLKAKVEERLPVRFVEVG